MGVFDISWGGLKKQGSSVMGGANVDHNAAGGPKDLGGEPSWSGTPAHVGPYTSGDGIQTGQAQPQMEGLDFSKQGAGELNWANNQGVYNSPSFGEVNTQGLVGQYSDPNNRPDVSNNSQNWFQQYVGAMPNIATDPGLAPYFDNAKNRAAESIDQAAGARGNYGSSAAIDQNARAFTDLEGQRALKEADYNLQRLGEQRAWQGLGGQLAGSADASSRAMSQDEQSWTQLLSQLGIDASRLGLDRTNSGQDAANSAQGAQRTRGQDYFSNQLALGDRMADLMKSTYMPALDQDYQMVGAANSGNVAQGNAALANEQANAQTTTDALKTGASLYGAIKK
jgi:hypothetical protein